MPRLATSTAVRPCGRGRDAAEAGPGPSMPPRAPRMERHACMRSCGLMERSMAASGSRG